MGVSIDITYRKLMEPELQNRFQEIQDLKQQLEKENVYLKDEAVLSFPQDIIVGKSVPIQQALSAAEQVALKDSKVLITDETGTGKELFDRFIHSRSKRRDRMMVRVNCGALPPTLIESELFGREKGAYTGAMSRESGRFEIAEGSTLFLDEIGELQADLKAKLLHFLESGEFERLGSAKTIKVDVRVIAATNRNLAEEVKKGNFREDLYYRLNVFPITVPPLRQKLENSERQVILRVLEKTGWRVKGANGAAEILKFKPSTLYRKMEKLGIPSRRTRRKQDGMPSFFRLEPLPSRCP